MANPRSVRRISRCFEPIDACGSGFFSHNHIKSAIAVDIRNLDHLRRCIGIADDAPYPGVRPVARIAPPIDFQLISSRRHSNVKISVTVDITNANCFLLAVTGRGDLHDWPVTASGVHGNLHQVCSVATRKQNIRLCVCRNNVRGFYRASIAVRGYRYLCNHRRSPTAALRIVRFQPCHRGQILRNDVVLYAGSFRIKQKECVKGTATLRIVRQCYARPWRCGHTAAGVTIKIMPRRDILIPVIVQIAEAKTKCSVAKYGSTAAIVGLNVCPLIERTSDATCASEILPVFNRRAAGSVIVPVCSDDIDIAVVPDISHASIV